MWKETRTLWQWTRGERRRYAGAVAALVGGTLLGYLVPLVMRGAINAAAGAASVPAGTAAAAAAGAAGVAQGWPAWPGGAEALAGNLWAAAAACVALTAASGLGMHLRGRWSAVASERIARRLRDRLYDHLQRLPCAYHDRADAGDLVQRCTSDVETVRGFLSSQVVEIGRALVMLAAAVPFLIGLDRTMALVSGVLLPPIVGFSLLFFVKIRWAFKQMDEAEGALTAVLQENLTGIRVVRAFGRHDFERAKFAERNARYRDADLRLIRLLAWYWSASDFMCLAQTGLVLLAGAWGVARGRLTVGDLYAFVAYVNMFLWPVRMMGRILADLGKAVVSVGRLREILDEPAEDQSRAGAGDGTRRVRGDIAFRDVSFGYRPGAAALAGVSFTVEAGRTLAILGPSGGGKSTIVQLLLRMYDPEGGSITLDGTNLRDLDRQFVRSQAGVVLQDPFLYSRTLRENIALGRAYAAADQVREAAAAACVHDAILDFEKGYDTLVGERGVTLSGGQRQRVALARTLLADPPILLLDDALSNVDTATEAAILAALGSRRGRHTTLVIAHRLSTLMHADRIIVLEGGRVVQAGTHDTLLREEGLYRRLWQIQGSLEASLRRDLSAAPPAAETREGGAHG